jgi:xanthine dehydrogenase accessory factor
MQQQLVTWELISNSLQQHIPVMLLYVLQSHGSSPGRQGFLMAVNKAGQVAGSIGGGIMEHKFVEMAKEQLQHFATSYSIHLQVHDKSAPRHQSGMICSGDQTILLYKLLPEHESTVNQIISCLQQRQQGTLQLSPLGLAFQPGTTAPSEFTMQSEIDWFYQEPIGFRDQLFIIGGGHCSLALSQLMAQLGFFVHVFEDRDNLHTLDDNKAAHEKTVLRDYNQVKELIPDGDHHYVTIMTVGYRTDDIVVRALFNKKFRYCGLLGSAAKVKKMFDTYLDEGIDAAFLSRMHAPMGLNINSHTPAEIAISIAAEIIQTRNAIPA